MTLHRHPLAGVRPAGFIPSSKAKRQKAERWRAFKQSRRILVVLWLLKFVAISTTAVLMVRFLPKVEASPVWCRMSK